MQMRRKNLPQSEMFLLLSRTSPPAHVLLLLLTGGIAMAMADQELTCQQELPPQLIRELWSRTRLLINKLPREGDAFKGWRLLPKFCVGCPQRAIGWLELQAMIDIYQRSVFSIDAVENLLPLHYNDLLDRLQYTLHNCVASTTPSKWHKIIKRMEKKIKKRKSNKRVMKAVAEFTFILRWMVELMEHHAR